MGGYAGEAPTKKLARAHVYGHIDALLPPERRGTATVLALAGPGAHDIGPIQATGLTSQPDRVLFVDTEAVGLRVAQDRWPGVRTFHGPLSQAPIPWPVDVAVLDFCGTIDSPMVWTGIGALRGRLRGGSVIAVTVQRGREAGIDRRAERLRSRHRVSSNHGANNLVRVGSLIAQVAAAAGVGFGPKPRGAKESDLCVLPAGYTFYRAHRVPMMVLVLKVSRYAKARSLPEMVAQPDLATPSVLVGMVDGLVASGWSVDRAAAILDVRPSTLAAWRAHRTMGTYGEA